jgi:hypothetical protein
MVEETAKLKEIEADAATSACVLQCMAHADGSRWQQHARLSR